MPHFNYYPILIDKEPYNLVVRSSFILFVEDGIFEALPNTIAFSIENQGTVNSLITIGNIFEIEVGGPALNFGGDIFMRRDDRLAIAFTGAGVDRGVITMDVVKGLVPLEKGFI